MALTMAASIIDVKFLKQTDIGDDITTKSTYIISELPKHHRSPMSNPISTSVYFRFLIRH